MTTSSGSQFPPTRYGGGGNPEQSARRGWLRAGWPILWLLLIVGLFDGVLFRGETFFERDLSWFHRPFRRLLVQLWHEAGPVPLWNPLSNMGKEFAANPHYAAFHPLSWLFLLLPWETAFRLQIILPLVGTGLAMFFLLRTLGLGRPAAHVGALSWAFGGLALSLTNLLPVLFTIAPAPALAAFALRVVRGGGRAAVAGTALCTALICAGGEPATILIAATVAAGSCLIEITAGTARNTEAPQREMRFWGVLARIAGATALGVTAAAVVIGPGLRLGAKSVRAAGLSNEESLSWSFPPARFVEFALPGALGQAAGEDADRYWGAALYPMRTYPLVYSIYPGLLITALALSGLVRPRGRQLGWGILALFGGAMAVGGHTLLWQGIRALVPGAGGIRFPEKWVIVPVFAVVVLAAEEFENSLASGSRSGRRAALALASIGGFAVLAAGILAGVRPAFDSGVFRWVGLVRLAAPDLARRLPSACLLQAALAGALLLAFRFIDSNRTGASVLVAALLALDLLVAGKPLVPTQNPVLAEDIALARAVQARTGSARLFNLADWQNWGNSQVTAPSLAAPAGWGIPTALEMDYDLTQPAWSRRASRLFLEVVRADPTLMSPLLARRGVGLVLQQRSASASHVVEITPVRDPRPDVACAECIVRFTDDAGWLATVGKLGAGARTAALVEASDGAELPGQPSPCTIRETTNQPGRISATVVGAGPSSSVVLINQTWHPGWQATVDGTHTALVRSDIDLCALPVPPGRHRIELVYRDPWVACSVVVSLAGILLCLALLIPRSRGDIGRP